MSRSNAAMTDGGTLPEEAPDNVRVHPSSERNQQLRIIEATLFAAREPLAMSQIAAVLPAGADIEALLEALQQNYANRGVNLVRVAGKWALRTADDLSFLLRREIVEQKRLS